MALISVSLKASDFPKVGLDYVDLDRSYADPGFLHEFPRELIGEQNQKAFWLLPEAKAEVRLSKFFPKEYEWLIKPDGRLLFFTQAESSFVPSKSQAIDSKTIEHSLMLTSSGWNEERRKNGGQTDFVKLEGKDGFFVKHLSPNWRGDLGVVTGDYIYELYQTKGKPKSFDILPEFLHVEYEGKAFSYRDPKAMEQYRQRGDHIIPIHSLVAWVKDPKKYEKEIAKYLKSRSVKDWHRGEYIPKFTEALVEANIKYGLYPNAHGQNTLLLVDGKTGKIKKVFYRDLEDFSLDFSVLEEKEKKNKSFQELLQRKHNRIGHAYHGEDSRAARDAGLKNYIFAEQSLLGLDYDVAERFVRAYINELGKNYGLNVDGLLERLKHWEYYHQLDKESVQRSNIYKKSLGNHSLASAFVVGAGLLYALPSGALDVALSPLKKPQYLAKAMQNIRKRTLEIYEPINFEKGTMEIYFLMQEAFREYHQTRLAKIRQNNKRSDTMNLFIEKELIELMKNGNIEYIDIVARKELQSIQTGKPIRTTDFEIEKRGHHLFVLKAGKIVAYSNTNVFQCKMSFKAQN
jgi:hypothetical protein